MNVSQLEHAPLSDETAGATAPRVSILVCTRDRADQLVGTLQSLQKIESAIPWEAVILDNGSKDSTRAVIEAACTVDPYLRYAYEAQPGLGAARDTGWRVARGEIIALSDDDCYFTADYVDAIWRAFAENPDIGVLGGRILLFDPEDVPLTIDTRSEPVRTPPRSPVHTGSFHGANLAFRRTALEKIGGFDRNLGAGTPFPAEDIDAVAATVWEGYAGLYDPRPTIFHHHRRRAQHVAPQMKKFDAGRGAYYAKYLMRPDTHAAYSADLRLRRGPSFRVKNPRRTLNETVSALRYLMRFGSTADKLRLGPIFAWTAFAAGLQRLFRAASARPAG